MNVLSKRCCYIIWCCQLKMHIFFKQCSPFDILTIFFITLLVKDSLILIIIFSNVCWCKLPRDSNIKFSILILLDSKVSIFTHQVVIGPLNPLFSARASESLILKKILSWFPCRTGLPIFLCPVKLIFQPVTTQI